MEVRASSAFRMVLYLAGLITYLVLRQFIPLDAPLDAPANPTNLDEPLRVSPRTSVPGQDASTVTATHPLEGQSRKLATDATIGPAGGWELAGGGGQGAVSKQ